MSPAFQSAYADALRAVVYARRGQSILPGMLEYGTQDGILERMNALREEGSVSVPELRRVEEIFRDIDGTNTLQLTRAEALFCSVVEFRCELEYRDQEWTEAVENYRFEEMQGEVYLDLGNAKITGDEAVLIL